MATRKKKPRKSRSGPSLSLAERPSPRVVITMPPATIERLDEIVESRGTTRSETLRHLVDGYEMPIKQGAV